MGRKQKTGKVRRPALIITTLKTFGKKGFLNGNMLHRFFILKYPLQQVCLIILLGFLVCK
jgi:hypothetical protein